MERSGSAHLSAAFVVVLLLGVTGAGSSLPAVAASVPSRADDTAPTVTVTPPTGLVDGQVVTVTSDVATPLEVSVCDAAVLSDLTLGGLIANCRIPTTILASSSGPFTVHQSFSTLLAHQVDCGHPTDCVVEATQQGSYTSIATTPISFSPQALFVAPAANLADGQHVDAWISAPSGSTQQVAQCALPVAASLATTACGPATSVVVPSTGLAHLDLTVAATLTTTTGPIDCGGSSCAFVRFDASGATVASVPIGITVVPTMVLTPSTGLLDGQSIDVTAARVTPGAPFALTRCVNTPTPSCDATPLATGTTSADGTIHTAVTASQRLLSPIGVGVDQHDVYCRLDGCSIGLSVNSTDVIAEAPYALAAGAMTATPSAGLADGQTVSLAGSDLMPTYDGPHFGPFASGGWAVAECRADMGSAPTLLVAFEDCGFPGGGGPVTIAGSTLSATVQPVASLTAVLGGVTDCRAAAGTCVVGLVRFEQDGSMSTHLTPLSFAS